MKKNILFLIGNMTSGGAEKVIYNLCNSLKNKYNITLVVRTLDNADYIPDVNIIEIEELRISRVMFKGISKLKRIKKELNIDISISFIMKYCVFNYLSKAGDKIYFSTRNYMGINKHFLPKSIIFKIFIKLYKKYIKRVDKVINVSKSVEEDQIKRYKLDKNNSVVIENYLDIENINKLKKEKLSREEMNIFKNDVILSVGRYNEQKGQWHLIRVFNEIVKYDNNIKLVLIGRGPLKEYYKKLVNDYNLNDKVFIFDFKENIYKYMYNSKLFVLNSFYEGMPNVLLESLACSLPIIASDSYGGTKEILSIRKDNDNFVNNISFEEYGVLVPICDYKKYKANYKLTKEEIILKDAILELLNNKKLYDNYKKKSINRVSDFSKEKILKKWERVLDEN